MYCITKQFDVEYSHYLDLTYSSPCSKVHGHTGTIKINIYSTKLDKNGMIIDFSQLRALKARIEEKFDHALLIKDENPELNSVLGQKCVVLGFNPTSENMAKEIFEMTCNYLKEIKYINASKVKIDFHETRNNVASYEAAVDIR